jgi:hypothetical protein
MKQKNRYILSDEFLASIKNIFHPNPDGSFFINHSCFLLINQTLTPYKMYILIDYETGSMSNITTFQLEDVVIFDNFLMITGLDILTGEEIGRMAYLKKNGCAFKLVDFHKMKDILNEMEGGIISLKAE